MLFAQKGLNWWYNLAVKAVLCRVKQVDPCSGEVVEMVDKAHHVAVCPDCQSSIVLPPSPELWMRVTCPECGTQLEIVDDNPWELDYAEDSDGDEEAGDTYYEDYDDDTLVDDDKESPWNT